MKRIYLLFVFITFTIYLLPLTLSSQPTQEWVRRFNWNNYSGSISLELDTTGNVYVLMRLSNPTTSNDYGLAKYSATGNLLWSANYNSPGNLNDQPKAFAVSKSGDVYITGTSVINFENHITTVKYNTNGVLQWARVYDGGGPGESTNDIKIDNNENVIIAGNIAIGNDTIKALTIKYDPNGDTLWTKKFNILPDDSGTSGIGIDDSNNVFVVGYYGYRLNQPDYLMLKYNSNGILQWFSTYDSPEHYQDQANYIVLDSLGMIYVVGSSLVPSAGFNNNLIKLNTLGQLQWAKIFRGILSGNGNCNTVPSGLAVSTDNTSIYFVTSCVGNIALTEITTIKYLSSGDSIWVKRYSGNANGMGNYPTSLKLDKNNNIYISGVINNNTSSDDFVVIRYSPVGTQQWIASYNGPLSNSFDRATGLAIDKNYNVYVTGPSSYFNGSPPLWETATIKYSQPDGIQPVSNEMPISNQLYQNFPNPFNPVTNFRFQISKFKFVSIKIYNVLGKEIASIVNEKLRPGVYELSFDGANFSSGIYFYTLATDDYRETKKMILVK